MPFFIPTRLKIAAVAATAAELARSGICASRTRLKIAAVAATAATTGRNAVKARYSRLKIAAVAATAAGFVHRNAENA